MKCIKFGFSLAALMALVSCSSGELGPPRDVAYYLEHEDERNAVIKKCENDLGRLGFEPNCKNALNARFKAPWRNNRVRPPPPGYSKWTIEEIEHFRGLSEEERDKYYEDVK